MDIRLLGRFAIVVDGAPLALGGHRQRAVLAVLATHANESISTDRIVDEVWDGAPPPSAVATLHRYVSHLRQALAGTPATIDTERPGYVLRIDDDAVDSRRFERLVDEGRRSLVAGAVDLAAGLLADALALWRGEPLADFAFDGFARIETTRLNELRSTALELRIDADLALGRHRQLVPELEALVAAHPLNESYRGQLMRALHGSGRRAEALRVYSDGRRVLAEELGLDPSNSLQQIERVILGHDGSAALSAEPAVVGRLPSELTSFVGRAGEVKEVPRLVAVSRLVTLTGVGGTGKSRLALRVASQLAPSFRHGAWLVELGSVSDTDDVARAVVTGLGLRDDPHRDAVDVVLDGLAQRGPCLVVLDGCEHLLDELVPLVERVLAHTSDVRVLATSREALGVAGETCFRVPTLQVPGDGETVATVDQAMAFDGVRLFMERARATDAGFAVDDGQASALAELCRRLDGMPLALELAAARMDVLTVAQLADRLDDRFAVLTGTSRTTPARHRTLRATIAWSYDLLDPSERLLFDRLSVFSGSFTLDNAEAVCSGDGVEPAQVFDLLAHLVRKSLVVRVDGSGPVARYRLLDTLKEFGRRCLDEAGAHEQVCRRHATFFTEVIERTAPFIRTPGGGWALEALDAENAELRAALAWLVGQGDAQAACRFAAAVAGYWDARFHLRTGRIWLERAVAMAAGLGVAPSPEVLWTAVGAAYFALMEDDFDTAERHCAAVDSLLGSVPDDRARIKVVTIRGEMARHGDDLATAQRLCAQAASLARQAGDAPLEADAQRMLSLIAWDRGDLDTATRHAEECLRLNTSVSDVERIAGAQGMLGSLLRDQGYFEQAARLVEDSLGRFQQLGEPLGMIFMLWQLATLAVLRGEPEDAGPFAEHGLQISENLSFVRGTGQSCLALAEADLALGRLDGAERWCDMALARFAERGFGVDTILGLETATGIRLARGAFGEAACCADEALAAAQEHGYDGLTGRALCLVAAVRARQGDFAAAATAAEEARLLFEQAGNPRGTARARVALGDAAVARGRADEASEHLLAARTVLAVSGASLSWREQQDYDRVSLALDASCGTPEPIGRALHCYSSPASPNRRLRSPDGEPRSTT